MMKEIKAIIRPDRLTDVLQALHQIPNLPGVTISSVRGFGKRYPDGGGESFDQVTMAKVEIVVPSAVLAEVLGAVERAAHTGNLGDGKIFVLPVEHAIRIRSGERDLRAI